MKIKKTQPRVFRLLRYAHNNPANRTDIFGLSDDSEYPDDCEECINPYYPVNGVGLTDKFDDDAAGYVQVDQNGKYVVRLNTKNLDITFPTLYNAIQNGDNLVTDILFESLYWHEAYHLTSAFAANPALQYSGVPGAYLGSTSDVTNGREYAAYQAQLNFLNPILESGKYMGDQLTWTQREQIQEAYNALSNKQAEYK